MGYVGGRDLDDFRERATFVRISNAGLRESHTHDVTITRESPNYPGRDVTARIWATLRPRAGTAAGARS